MKTLYLDCSMGAAGDMLSAALCELFDDPQQMVRKMNEIGIPDVRFTLEPSVKCGISGSHMHVHVHGMEEHEHHEHEHDHYEHEHEFEYHEHEHEHEYHEHEHRDHEHEHRHEHHHSGPEHIAHIISDLALTDEVKRDATAVFDLLAEAESHVHGVPVTDIHFHEVGTMDAVADIVGACFLLHELQVGEVIASPVNTGSGHVHCAHGVLPVPAPAAAYLLRGVPIYSGDIRSELCTPTGAALLKYFVTRFGDMPVMRTTTIGYGMGSKDFDTANCLRALLGETADVTDSVLELSCNVDDMTGEAVGFAVKKLFEAGVLDVYTAPIYMKKNRPGTMICVLCKLSDKEAVLHALFKYTTTLGVREVRTARYTLDRRIETQETPYGTIRRKISDGYGVQRIKIEADDLERIADEQNCSLSDACRRIEEA